MNNVFIISIVFGGLIFFVGYWAGQRNTAPERPNSAVNYDTWGIQSTEAEYADELKPLTADVEAGILTAINGLRDGELRLKIMNWLAQF